MPDFTLEIHTGPEITLVCSLCGSVDRFRSGTPLANITIAAVEHTLNDHAEESQWQS